MAAPATAFALSVLAIPVQAQSLGFPGAMSGDPVTMLIEQIALPHYTRAEQCGANEAQLAAIRRSYRDGKPGLRPTIPESLFQRLVPKKWNGDPVTDGQLEKGSLFSPYWQARLVETPKSLYLAAGISGLVGAP